MYLKKFGRVKNMSKDIDDIFSNNLEDEINKKIKSDRKNLI